jgi:hexulose-6-phosphate isomerase
MQGRLLPKYSGRYQAHPVGYWENEFGIAASLGLSCIEFILDYNDADINPLLNSAGIDAILEISSQAGISVRSVCADYFMEAPLHNEDQSAAERSAGVLRRLIKHGAELGLKDIVIPCVDQSSLKGTAATDRFVRAITSILPAAEAAGVNLSLETDFAPEPFAALLARLDSPAITVNYDTGNSASLGFDPAEELQAYGHRISDIHIKDRIKGGGSVVLGTGNADLSRFFDALKPLNFSGPFIMQAYRDDEGVEIFKKQFDWVVTNYFRPYGFAIN